MTNKFLQSVLAKKASSKTQNGFTLIELMVVIAIVGVLSSVGLPQLLKSQDRAKDAAASATLVNAAKECSMDLIAGEPTPTTFASKGYLDAAGATRIVNACVVATGETNATTLGIVSESGNKTEFEVTFEGVIPNPVAPKAASGNG